MKILLFIILFGINIFLFAPSPHIPTVPDSNRTLEMSVQELNNFQQEDSNELGDEDDMFFYEQESFSRKLFQRKLTPLSKPEKIIWAFRMSEPDLFL
jgi:hypothetical protein